MALENSQCADLAEQNSVHVITPPVSLDRVWQTHAVTIEDINIPANVSLRGHGHDVPHLFFLLEGAYREKNGIRHREISRNTLRSSPAGDVHDLTFEMHSRCLLVQIQGDLVAVPPKMLSQRLYTAGPRIEQLVAELYSVLFSNIDPSPLELESLILELTVATRLTGKRRTSAPPVWLVQIKEQLRDSPKYPPGTAELAKNAGYHPVYIARHFRRHYGMGLGEYARFARAEYARDKLLCSDLSISQVALDAGYADHSHLCRAMNKLLATTPKHLRKR